MWAYSGDRLCFCGEYWKNIFVGVRKTSFYLRPRRQTLLDRSSALREPEAREKNMILLSPHSFPKISSRSFCGYMRTSHCLDSGLRSDYHEHIRSTMCLPPTTLVWFSGKVPYLEAISSWCPKPNRTFGLSIRCAVNRHLPKASDQALHSRLINHHISCIDKVQT